MANKPLRYEAENDYVLEGKCCWITAGNLSIHVSDAGDAIIVNIFPLGGELDDPIASTYAGKAR